MFLAFSSDQTDAFFIQALPLLSPAFWGVPPHSPSVFVSFGINLLQSWFCFIIPFPPPASLPPFYASLVCPPELGSYLRIVLHALDSLYDTCVQASLSLSPPPSSSPNILSLVLVWILLRPFCLLPGFCHWGRRGLRVARRAVIACVLRVCNVCGLQ